MDSSVACRARGDGFIEPTQFRLADSVLWARADRPDRLVSLGQGTYVRPTSG
jgi:hypothetical protein